MRLRLPGEANWSPVIQFCNNIRKCNNETPKVAETNVHRSWWCHDFHKIWMTEGQSRQCRSPSHPRCHTTGCDCCGGPALLAPPTIIVTTTEGTFLIRIKNDVAEWLAVARGASAGDLEVEARARYKWNWQNHRFASSTFLLEYSIHFATRAGASFIVLP